MLKKLSYVFLLLCLAGLLGFRFYLTKQANNELNAQVLPPASEMQSRKGLLSKFTGQIVFDSNRSGTFGIYSINANGSELTKIFDSPLEDMFPDPSPDGQWIVFTQAKTLGRESYSDIWLVRKSGTEPRLLAENGAAATFSANGKTIYFERDKKRIMAVDLEGANEREIFPAGSTSFGNYVISKPRISDDAHFASFISDKNGRWNSWIADLESKDAELMGRGCEATWYPIGSNQLAWIQKKEANALAGSGIFTFKRETKTSTKLHDDGPPFGHEYFPEITPDNNFLLYGACPHDQHSHESANYQLYIKDLKSGENTRITLDPFTNRWPKFLRASS